LNLREEGKNTSSDSGANRKEEKASNGARKERGGKWEGRRKGKQRSFLEKNTRQVEGGKKMKARPRTV